MDYLVEEEEMEFIPYFNMAAELAKEASCLRRKCGAIIVKGGIVIGKGFNSPSGGLESQRRCLFNKEKYERKVGDKTCCVHAEQRAIFNALRNNPNEIIGSRLYFTSVDKNGEIVYSGRPYCTSCSKLALDVGISEFVLWHNEGICFYDTRDYNKLSYLYKQR